ncbi:MAG: hypothetical protein CMJ58_00440 [Planctomycetaceae bacterium]|nr:hypothetical protein [Planctomycetaceae bacterium]
MPAATATDGGEIFKEPAWGGDVLSLPGVFDRSLATADEDRDSDRADLANPAALSPTGPSPDRMLRPAQAAFGLDSQARGSSRSPRSFPRRSSRQPTALRTSGLAAGGLSSIPYMIGDTGAGTCIAFNGLLDAELSHPTLACGRLNVAENNSPLPSDRLYLSYRHFHNASPVSLYQYRESHHIDRYMLGSERTLLGGMASWEIRLPINYQLTNNVITIFDEVSGAGDLVANPNREAYLGNLSIIMKCLLIESRQFAVSAGLGVTVPTAPDVRYQVGLRGEVVYSDFPDFSIDSLTALSFDFSNDTVYLAPFLSWIYAPGNKWFHQGFLQVEAAANPSTVTANGISLNTFQFLGTPVGFYDFSFDNPTNANLNAQTLMRVNLGIGRELLKNPRSEVLARLVALAELHYTHTLEDAALGVLPTTNASGGVVLADFQELTVGNQANQVDILNAALGLQATMGPFIVTNGFVAPLRRAPDRGFDFEYNLQVQLPY